MYIFITFSTETEATWETKWTFNILYEIRACLLTHHLYRDWIFGYLLLEHVCYIRVLLSFVDIENS